MQQKFNALLENEVRNSLNTLFSRGKRTIHPDPNESTLLTLSPSASSLHNAVLPIEAEEHMVLVQPRNQMIREDSLIFPETHLLSILSDDSPRLSLEIGAKNYFPH